MAKKRHAKAKNKAKSEHQPIPVLTTQAEAHLRAGRFREAVEAYKQLLKREPTPARQAALAEAYLGRAGQLAAKALYKEAAALWENMAALCGQQHLDRYLDWLLRAGRMERAARLFAEADPAWRDSPAGRDLAARLAGLLLAGCPGIVGALPADAPLIAQHQRLQEALSAYSRGDDGTMQESLQTIPFRSPYRDLKPILQAMAALPQAPADALELLARVKADSPFAPFADRVRLATLDGQALLEAITGLTEPEREFVLTLKGWDADQIAALRRLPDPHQADAKALFTFALQSDLPTDHRQRFCRTLLSRYPAGLKAYEKHFGELSAFERSRLQALAAEERRDYRAATLHWRHCVTDLNQNPGKDDPLRAALVLRHMAELIIKDQGPDPWHPQLLEYLTRSLELDPEDKPTYFQLLDMARQRDDRKALDHWTERAVSQFPGDPEVLLLAGAAAYRRNAFKKAARYAANLLERDPIHSQARHLLIACHLAQVRKQAKAGKYHLAERELASAAEHAREPWHRGAVTLNQGLLALARGMESEAEPLLRQGLQQLGGLAAELRFLMDGALLGLPLSRLSRQLKTLQTRRPPATVREVLALAELSQRYIGDKVQGLSKALDHLRQPLEAAARQDFSEPELEKLLETWRQAGHHRLLAVYAETAMDRFGSLQPRFIYYAVFGRTKGRQQNLTRVDRSRLKIAGELAMKEQDIQTADLIAGFLGYPPGLSGPLPADITNLLEKLMDELDMDHPDELLDLLQGELDDLPNSGFPLPLPRPRRNPK